MQMMRLSHGAAAVLACAIGFGLLAAAPATAQTANVETKAAAPKKSESRKKAKAPKKSAAEKPAKEAPSADAPKKPEPQNRNEPKTIAADKLPKAILTLHTCVAGKQEVDFSSERYAKSVLFFVTCPAARGALTPISVFVAKNTKAAGAKRVMFEILNPDGTPGTRDATFSAVPAREAYSKPDDKQSNLHARNDPPWISGAWGPDDRPGVCAVTANWRVQGDKAELMLWDEAKECPRNELPKYESKLDKKPPALVGR